MFPKYPEIDIIETLKILFRFNRRIFSFLQKKHNSCMNTDSRKTTQKESMLDSSVDIYQSLERKRTSLERPPPAQRSTCYNYMLAMTIAFGGLPMGWYLSILNPMGEHFIQQIYGVDKEDYSTYHGLLNLYWCLGCMFGSLFGGWVAKSIGPFRGMIYVEVLRMVILGMYCIPDLVTIQITRALCGLTIGIFTVLCPLATTQVLPPSIQAFGGIMFFATNTGAILLAALSGQFLSEQFINDYWRIILTWPAVFTVARFLLLAFVFRMESPQF
jgi:MFS family permease